MARRIEDLGQSSKSGHGSSALTDSAWLPWVRVPDANATAVQVVERGGAILHGPLEVPGGDLVARCQDRKGVAFALHSTKGE